MIFQQLKLFASLFLLLILSPFQNVSAQDYDHFIPLSQSTVDADAMSIQPGDVVCLEAGTRAAALRLLNLQGTASNPIVIKNCGGKTLFNIPLNSNGSRAGSGISISNSNHFRLTGTGDDTHQYGIDVAGPVMGVAVGGLSKEGVEVDHISVHDVGFAGIMVKTDPGCDPGTWRENFPEMRDVRVHDNYVYHTIDGEGFYIGFTFSDGYEITCNGEKITVYGHLIKNLDLYNNRTEDTGSEGIQVSSSPGARIHHNVVIDAGVRPFADYQNNGVQIGYHDTMIYNNWIEKARANGLIIFGTGHDVYNNVIVDAGAHGTFADDRAEGSGLIYVHNTVINPKEDGVRLYYDETTPSIFKNNIIAEPGGTYFVKLNGVDVEESNNLYVATAAEAGFINADDQNYHLKPGSPAIDTGANTDIAFDYDGISRPQGLLPDIGAYEWFLPDDGTFTELLQNGGFETQAAWTAKGNGKTVCNKPDKTVAYEAACAYQLKVTSGSKTKVAQEITAALNVAAIVRLGAQVNGKKIHDGASAQITAKLTDVAGEKQKYKVAIAPGTYAYTEVFNVFTLDRAISSIKVQVQYKAPSGKLRIDNVSFALKEALPLLPLP